MGGFYAWFIPLTLSHLHSLTICNGSPLTLHSNLKPENFKGGERKENVIDSSESFTNQSTLTSQEDISHLRKIVLSDKNISDHDYMGIHEDALLQFEIILRLSTSLHEIEGWNEIDDDEQESSLRNEKKRHAFIIQLAKTTGIERKLEKLNKDINDPDFLVQDAYIELNLPHHTRCFSDETKSHGLSYVYGNDDEIPSIPQNSMRKEAISSGFKIRHRQFHLKIGDHNQGLNHYLLSSLSHSTHEDLELAGGHGIKKSSESITAAIVNYTLWETYVNHSKSLRQSKKCFGEKNSSISCLTSGDSSTPKKDGNKSKGNYELGFSSEQNPFILKDHESQPKLLLLPIETRNGEVEKLVYNCVKRSSRDNMSDEIESDDSSHEIVVIDAVPLIRLWLRMGNRFCPDKSRDVGKLVFAFMIDGNVVKPENEEGKEKAAESGQDENIDQGMKDQRNRQDEKNQHLPFGIDASTKAVIRIKYAMDRKYALTNNCKFVQLFFKYDHSYVK